MIRFVNVSKTYGHYHALNRVTFSIQKGEMAFLTGHSGAGKSTLLKLIMRIDKQNAGQIFVNDRNIDKLSGRKVPELRRQIGMIFQNPQLLMNRSVYENIALPLFINRYRDAEIKRRVRAALDKVGLLSKEKHLPHALSTGEQQRIGIARAIVNKPSLVLADEPTGNLDPELSMEIMRLFEAFNAVGVSVLVATHDLSLIAPLNHRIITLRNGELVHGGDHD